MKMRNVILIFIVLVLLVSVAGCGNITGKAVKEEDTIKLGAIFILSGYGAEWGLQSREGAALTIKRINAQGGVNSKKLELVVEDNPGDDAKSGLAAFRKLRMQGINLIIGTTYSGSGLAIAPVACNEDLVMISPTLGIAGFNERCDKLFNLWPHDELLSKTLGEKLFKNGYKKIAVLGSTQVWEKDQAEAVKRGFEKAGGEVVAFELHPHQQKDLRAEATKIKAAEPDAVVFTNFGTEDIGARRLREIGVKAPFFSVLVETDKVKAARGALNGTVVITSFTPTEEYVRMYKKEYGKMPGVGSDTTYDAVMLLAEAMKKTGSEDPKKITGFISGLKTLKGASGNMTFDDKGGVTKKPMFKQVKGEELKPIKF